MLWHESKGINQSLTESALFHVSLAARGVLVIDDSPVQRDAAVEQLQILGITRLWSAQDGRMGLHLIQVHGIRPAVVCVDLEMPGMDGIEFLQNLIQLDARPAVIILSGANSAVLNSVGLMVETLGLPLLGVIAKPLTTGRLCQALLRFSDVAEQPRAHRNAPVCMAREDLVSALATGRMVPYYQPKVSLQTGEVVGFEALARCITTDGHVLPPSSFIDLAEQAGLMDALTLSIFEGVLSDLAGWHTRNISPLISINISASSLADRNLGDEIMRRLDAASISPSAITLEITESALVTDLAAAIGMLGRMRLKGFGLSLDDFGTGFSSLQQLDRLPFTELKIDRSFVSEVDQRASRQRILTAAIRTGEELNLMTVAEGVETLGELSLLKKLGCHQVQGYLIAKPMPREKVYEWLLENQQQIKKMCLE